MALLLVSSHSLVVAEESTEANEWLQFFVGDWKRASTILLDNQETKNVSDWSCKPAAGGATNVSTGKTPEGDEWVDMFGWDGYHESIHEFGKMSAGDTWIIDFKIVDSRNLRGEAVGALPDGRKGKGSCAIERTGKDSYNAVFELTLNDGSKFKVTDKNTRKN